MRYTLLCVRECVRAYVSEFWCLTVLYHSEFLSRPGHWMVWSKGEEKNIENRTLQNVLLIFIFISHSFLQQLPVCLKLL